MATDGGDIRFTFTGDSSGLNSELKKVDKNLGEVSKATAGAANGLERGFTKGAKAADKAADGMSKSIAKATSEMEEAGDEAKNMGDKFEAASDSAGQTSSSLGAISGALAEVNPEMAEIATTAADAAGAMEGLLVVIKKHPAAAAVVAAATAAMGFAFSEATEKIEAQEEALKKIDRRQDKTISALEAHKALQDEIAAAYETAQRKSADYTVELQKEEQRIFDVTDALLKQLQTQARQGDISEKSYIKQTTSARARRDEMIKEARATAHLRESERIANEERKIRAKQRIEDDKAAAQAAKDKASSDQRAAKSRAELVKQEEAYDEALSFIQQTIIDTDIARRDSIVQAEHEARKKISLIEDTSEELIKNAEDLGRETWSIEWKTAMAITLIEQEKQDKIAKIKADAREKQKAEDQKLVDWVNALRDEDIEKDAQKRADAAAAATQVSSSLMEITSLLEEEMANASIEERERLFRVQKGASIAEATINGAVAVTNALKMGPVAAAIAAAAITATTAAQISLIAQQEPAFDTGGLVRGGLMARSPDQMSARVLPGESILNRSATDRIGEQGVNALNGGAPLGGVTVVPAYRHFDRFIRNEYRRGGSFRRIVTREREFPVGQRRY